MTENEQIEFENLKRRVAKLERGWPIPDIIKSKKFQVTLIGAISGLAAALWKNGPPPAEIAAALSPLMAYVLGQGVADIGKERVKMEERMKI